MVTEGGLANLSITWNMIGFLRLPFGNKLEATRLRRMKRGVGIWIHLRQILCNIWMQFWLHVIICIFVDLWYAETGLALIQLQIGRYPPLIDQVLYLPHLRKSIMQVAQRIIPRGSIALPPTLR